MAEFKKGQKYKVSYIGEYVHTGSSGCHYFNAAGARAYSERFDVPPDATIEVIEEPFEEGAIYEFGFTPTRRYKMAYLPVEGKLPWVYISGALQELRFGERFGSGSGPIVKLAPLAQ